METVYRTELPGITLAGRGKVRDIYEVEDMLMLVATDRLSAFDVVFPTPIPWKGVVLTQLSLFWFEHTKSIIENHIIESDIVIGPRLLWRNLVRANRSR